MQFRLFPQSSILLLPLPEAPFKCIYFSVIPAGIFPSLDCRTSPTCMFISMCNQSEFALFKIVFFLKTQSHFAHFPQALRFELLLQIHWSLRKEISNLSDCRSRFFSCYNCYYFILNAKVFRCYGIIK
jgi:hypothetical protein